MVLSSKNFRSLRGKSLAAPVFGVGGRPPRGCFTKSILYNKLRYPVLHHGTEVLQLVLQIGISRNTDRDIP